MEDPTSMMSPVYHDLTCPVGTNLTESCRLGAYPSYAINVSNVPQIQLGTNFARNTNIRLSRILAMISLGSRVELVV